MKNTRGEGAIGWIVLLLLVVMSIGGCAAYIPKYRLYSQDYTGQANLKQQEWEKKIAIESAKAKKQSAIYEAEAEIERAKGVAEANRIIGESLQQNENYIKYLWIDGLKDIGENVIYVPTEAGLPILEAGKR